MAFIVFEGLDGAGKSSLIKGLASELTKRKIHHILTREPGGTGLAEHIRELLLNRNQEVPHPRTEALLYQAGRAQHTELVIRPALTKGDWVICDRFTASSIAFQGFGRSLKRDDIEWLNEFSTHSLKPQLTVLLDLSVEKSLERIENRNKNQNTESDRFEVEKKDFHQKVRQAFLLQAHENPDAWLILNAEKSPENLKHELLEHLQKKGLLDA